MSTETQLHVTLLENVLIPEAVPAIAHERSVNKPRGGFWTSTWFGSGSDWTRWCEGNDWATPEREWRGFLLTPDTSAKVLTIDSIADMNRLPWRFGALGLASYEGVDWAAVFAEYDAVHLTERGQRATHLNRHNPVGRDLYGWDSESTVWKRWAFESSTPITFPITPEDDLRVLGGTK